MAILMREHSVVDRKLDIRIDVDETFIVDPYPGFDARLLIVAEFNNRNRPLSLPLKNFISPSRECARNEKAPAQAPSRESGFKINYLKIIVKSIATQLRSSFAEYR